MKYFLIAGEASGDLHAANLMKELKRQDENAVFKFFGGDRMLAQGGELIKHYKQMDFMGFAEVIANLGKIRRNFRDCKNALIDFNPDAVVFVDYPGFNLRMAKFAKENGFKSFYYISPKVWAWKESRVKKIKNYVDELLIIFPFEKAFYKKHNYKAHYVGNPLLDAVKDFKPKSQIEFFSENSLEQKPIFALLPGSRKQEIKRMLPLMSEMADIYKNYEFVIAASNDISRDFYHKYLSNKKIKLIYNQTYDLLQNSSLAMVTSGTATLETALFEVPQVVCYKANAISYQIAKKLVKVDFISLVNLIMDREVVKELIQHDFNKDTLINEINKIINPEQNLKMKSEYKEIKKMLGDGTASTKAAEYLIGKI